MSSSPDPFEPGVYVGALLELPGVGRAAVRRAVERFGSPRLAWQAPAQEWCKTIPRLNEAAMVSLRSRRDPRALERLAGDLRRARAWAITPWDPSGATCDDRPVYPLNARLLPDYPPVLYVRGTLRAEDRYAVALVGSREADASGLMAAEAIAAELSTRGCTIVSGLARGIDAAGHRGALGSGGRTVAVLGCGVDRVYPPEHVGLARRVAGQGAVVTEYPPGTPPDRWRLAARNYVIAAISLTVFVCEARSTSGALRTAEMATSMSREVVAVSGDITKATCWGSNALMRDGAAICTRVDDAPVLVAAALDAIERADRERAATDPAWAALIARAQAHRPNLAVERPVPEGPPAPEESLEPPARAVLKVLRLGPMDVDELSYRADMALRDLLRSLTQLEAAGHARKLADGRWGPRRL